MTRQHPFSWEETDTIVTLGPSNTTSPRHYPLLPYLSTLERACHSSQSLHRYLIVCIPSDLIEKPFDPAVAVESSQARLQPTSRNRPSNTPKSLSRREISMLSNSRRISVFHAPSIEPIATVENPFGDISGSHCAHSVGNIPEAYEQSRYSTKQRRMSLQNIWAGPTSFGSL